MKSTSQKGIGELPRTVTEICVKEVLYEFERISFYVFMNVFFSHNGNSTGTSCRRAESILMRYLLYSARIIASTVFRPY